jgi:lipopolysaccharide heptosyltransferase II
VNLNLAKYVDRYAGILLCYLLAALHLFREMIAPREGAVRVRRILMAKFWGIGNIVMLLPVIRLVRRRYPDAEIHFLTLRRNREILDGFRDLDRVWTLDDHSFPRFFGSLLRTVAGLRRARIDLFLDFEQFSRTSTLIGFVAGAPQRIGLRTPRQGRYLLYTAPVRYRDDQHMTRTFLDIARAAGVENRYEPCAIEVGEGERRCVASLVPESRGRFVVIHPGSGDNFIGRRWPAACFAALADSLVRQHGVAVVVTGGAGERSLAAAVIGRMAERHAAVDLSGSLSVRELFALLARAELLVANDTGPVHIASALGCPVLGLYGPNTPVLYGPLSPGSRAFYRDLPCSPCITNMNYKTSFCRLPVCIRDIPVSEVLAEANRLLSAGGRSSR